MPDHVFELRQTALRKGWSPHIEALALEFLDQLICGLEPPTVIGLTQEQINDVEAIAQRFHLVA